MLLSFCGWCLRNIYIVKWSENRPARFFLVVVVLRRPTKKKKKLHSKPYSIKIIYIFFSLCILGPCPWCAPSSLIHKCIICKCERKIISNNRPQKEMKIERREYHRANSCGFLIYIYIYSKSTEENSDKVDAGSFSCLGIEKIRPKKKKKKGKFI